MMQKNDIKIYKAEASDISAIAELEKKCFSVPWSEAALSDTMSRDSTAFIIAKCGERICGYIGSYYVMDEGYITNVAVDPEFRRIGVGQALVSALIEHGKALALTFWTLEVRVGNVAAIALYEKLGFKSVGIRPRFYSEPCEDAVLMTYYM